MSRIECGEMKNFSSSCKSFSFLSFTHSLAHSLSFMSGWSGEKRRFNVKLQHNKYSSSSSVTRSSYWKSGKRVFTKKTISSVNNFEQKTTRTKSKWFSSNGIATPARTLNEITCSTEYGCRHGCCGCCCSTPSTQTTTPPPTAEARADFTSIHFFSLVTSGKSDRFLLSPFKRRESRLSFAHITHAEFNNKFLPLCSKTFNRARPTPHFPTFWPVRTANQRDLSKPIHANLWWCLWASRRRPEAHQRKRVFWPKLRVVRHRIESDLFNPRNVWNNSCSSSSSSNNSSRSKNNNNPTSFHLRVPRFYSHRRNAIERWPMKIFRRLKLIRLSRRPAPRQWALMIQITPSETRPIGNGAARTTKLPSEVVMLDERRKMKLPSGKKTRFPSGRSSIIDVYFPLRNSFRATLLEQENIKLRLEVSQLKQETAKLRCMVFTAS